MVSSVQRRADKRKIGRSIYDENNTVLERLQDFLPFQNRVCAVSIVHEHAWGHDNILECIKLRHRFQMYSLWIGVASKG